MASKKKTTITVEITNGDLTTGAWVEGASTSGSHRATWAGTYDGERPSQHDGIPYRYFRNGHINGHPQVIFGFPVAQFSA